MLPAPPDLPVIRYTEVVSTNLTAIEQGKQGAPHGTIITAARQSGGRGRQGRSFASPPGGLYFSLILRPQSDAEHISLLTLATGVSCCRVVEQASGLDVKLKWPNDLYLGNRKLGGILSEAAPFSYRAGKVPFLVVGIGLNINTEPDQFPQTLQNTVTSLNTLQKRTYDLDKLMLDIAAQVEEYISRPEELHEEIVQQWRQRDYLRDKQMCWHGPGVTDVIGTGAGLLADGRYGLQIPGGDIIPILGGELKLLTMNTE